MNESASNIRPRSLSSEPPSGGVRRCRVGCVSYLNAKPLIEGAEEAAASMGLPAEVRFAVPSALLGDLEAGDVDAALCPVIDFWRSKVPLVILPAGGISSDGETLTVRLFSRKPIAETQVIHADMDSHTSVALVQVLLREMFSLRPTMVNYEARTQSVRDASGIATAVDRPETVLLIGDKVVTNSPRAIEYPHQLDLGTAWRELTGLPFVFAAWMAPADTDAQTLASLTSWLTAIRERNAGRGAELAATYAARHGWPMDLAERYLSQIMRYPIGDREREAITRFGRYANACGLATDNLPPRFA